MKNNLDNVFNLIFAGAITLAVCLIFGIKIWSLIFFIFALSYPWKIKGNIISLFGGATCSGSVYSLVPLLQISSKNCYGILSPLCIQKAGKEVGLVFGISLQKGHNIWVMLGIPLLQEGHDIWVGFGIILFQTATRSSQISCGIVMNQAADEEAVVGIGMALRQRAKKAYIGFGIPLIQKAEEYGCDWGKAQEMLDVKQEMSDDNVGR